MGIFDFFRRERQSKIITREISFKNIQKEIREKIYEIEKNQQDPKLEIQEALSELLKKLNPEERFLGS
jgi:hypothetical protein